MLPTEREVQFVGAYSCAAANEPDHRLEAHLFYIRAGDRQFVVAAELEEAVWIPAVDTGELHLAPFTRDHVLPLALALRRHRPQRAESRR